MYTTPPSKRFTAAEARSGRVRKLMSAEGSWQHDLLAALQDRGIKVSATDVDHIKKARDDSPLAQWVDHNIQSNQPLTLDELTIWQYIQKSGRSSRPALTNHGSKSVALPMTEDELRHAMTEIDASTSMLEEQCSVIERQQTLLKAHHQRRCARHQTPVDPMTALENGMQQKILAESQQLRFMNAESSSVLGADLSVMQDRAEKSIKATAAIVTERLRSDDRTLDELNQQVVSGSKSNPATEFDIDAKHQRIDSLTLALRQVTISTTKDRLDRIYLETLRDSTDDDHSPYSISDKTHDSSELEKQIHLVEQDLQSLYPEIDDVATMLIQHEHENPLNAAMRAVEAERRHEESEERLMILTTLESLTRTLKTLSSRYEALHSHRLVISHLQQALQHTTAINQTKIPHTITSQHKTPLPTQRAALPSTSYFKTLDTNTGTTSPALTSLLQSLDVSSSPSLSRPTQPLFQPPSPSRSRTQSQTHHSSLTTPTTTPHSQIAQTSSSLQNTSDQILTSLVQTIQTTTQQQDTHLHTLLGDKPQTRPVHHSAISSSSANNNPFQDQLSLLDNLDKRITSSRQKLEAIQ